MSQLIYPHVGLFLYTLNQSGEAIQSASYQPEESIEGQIDAFTEGDTNYISTLASVKDQNAPKDVSSVEGLKESVLKQPIILEQSKFPVTQQIGKTWMVLGCLNSLTNSATIAEAICEEIKFMKWSYPVPQNYLGATLYELWNPPQDWKTASQADNHLVIILFPRLEALNSFGKYYESWLRLFHFRNKVIWAYSNTRQIKPILQKHFFPQETVLPAIQVYRPELAEIELPLEDLKRDLQENYVYLSRYANCLSFLEIQLEALKTNTSNYQERLNQIIQAAHQINPETDRDLLNSFLDLSIHKYQNQIERDLATLAPGLRVREKITETIRGMVELEQAERDRRSEARNRSFQNWLAIIGTGIGAASLTSGTILPFSQEILQTAPQANSVSPPSPWLSFGFTLTSSVLVGLVVSTLVKVLLERLENSNKPRQK